GDQPVRAAAVPVPHDGDGDLAVHPLAARLVPARADAERDGHVLGDPPVRPGGSAAVHAAGDLAVRAALGPRSPVGGGGGRGEPGARPGRLGSDPWPATNGSPSPRTTACPT